MEKVFTDIYINNGFDPNYKSGLGASYEQAKYIIKEIPKMIKLYDIKTVFDCPCGDFNWMKYIYRKFDKYIGADIVKELVLDNIRHYPGIKFVHFDILHNKIPKCDLILCRDLFVHFKFAESVQAFRNIKRSGCKFLLMTTFTGRGVNEERDNTGDWRTVNFQIEPYNFPPPLFVINEQCTEFGGQFIDKCLALWNIKDIPDF